MGLLRNIRLARDAARIAADGRYCVDGNEVALPRVDLREVKVISPEDGAGILAECQGRCKPGGCCVIRVVAEDSFEAAMRYERPLVMSFANAHCPGGGFWLGANAQEESLCRRVRSTRRFRPRRRRACIVATTLAFARWSPTTCFTRRMSACSWTEMANCSRSRLWHPSLRFRRRTGAARRFSRREGALSRLCCAGSRSCFLSRRSTGTGILSLAHGGAARSETSPASWPGFSGRRLSKTASEDCSTKCVLRFAGGRTTRSSSRSRICRAQKGESISMEGHSVVDCLDEESRLVGGFCRLVVAVLDRCVRREMF